jgi:hypothetical protein
VAVKYVTEKGKAQLQVSESEYRELERQIYQPLANYRVGRNEITIVIGAKSRTESNGSFGNIA